MNAIPQLNPPIEKPFFDKKTGAIALVSVLALHGLLAVGLANMTIPDIKPPVVTPPLEITFVTPPPPEVIKLEEKKPEEIKPTVPPKVTPQPKAEPVKPLSKAEPLPKPEPIIQKVIPPKLIQSKQEKQPPKEPEDNSIKKSEKEPEKEPEKIPEKDPPVPPPETKTPETNQNTLKARQFAEQSEREENEHKRIQAETARQAQLIQQKAIDEQNERNRIQADAERKRADDETKRKAKADAEAEAKAKQDLADKKARAEADDKAVKARQAKAKRDKEEAEAKESAKQDDSPVTISDGQAHWKSRPSFSCGSNDTGGQTLRGTVRYTVDKQGRITSSGVSKSSGNSNVDRAISQQARRASFYPYTKNGVPVVSTVFQPFTVSCS